MIIKKISFKKVLDGRDGIIQIAEANKEIPFSIKRVYFIDKFSRNSIRGFHAHKKLKQVITALRGKFVLQMYDGKKSEKIWVSKYSGVLIPPLCWHVMDSFSTNCLIAVFASDYYKESDYIRDFHEFKRCVS